MTIDHKNIDVQIAEHPSRVRVKQPYSKPHEGWQFEKDWLSAAKKL